MQAFTRLTAIAAPLRRDNVDTDQIIPMRFLITAARTGLGTGLFADWRYAPDRSENPEFVLNKARHRNAAILVAGANFGCGSSREHAPWALLDYGIRAIVAPSFANIFHDNAGKNGILLVPLPAVRIEQLFEQLERGEPTLTVDLEAQQITDAAGRVYPFSIDARRRTALLQGLDEIGTTLRHEPEIAAFQAQDRARRPWVYRH